MDIQCSTIDFQFSLGTKTNLQMKQIPNEMHLKLSLYNKGKHDKEKLLQTDEY